MISIKNSSLTSSIDYHLNHPYKFIFARSNYIYYVSIDYRLAFNIQFYSIIDSF